MHSPSLAPSPPPPLLKFIALGVYGLFPSWCTSPPFPSHLASAYCMYYALGVFAAVYEYTCPFTPLSRSSPPSPPPPLPPPLPPPASSLFSLPASLQLPSWQTGKQTASFGPVLSLGVASSHSSQHGHTHAETHTRKHAHTSPTP